MNLNLNINNYTFILKTFGSSGASFHWSKLKVFKTLYYRACELFKCTMYFLFYLFRSLKKMYSDVASNRSSPVTDENWIQYLLYLNQLWNIFTWNSDLVELIFGNPNVRVYLIQFWSVTGYNQETILSDNFGAVVNIDYIIIMIIPPYKWITNKSIVASLYFSLLHLVK